ncbi:hypothetical protein D3C72_633250 [compost metagenome]
MKIVLLATVLMSAAPAAAHAESQAQSQSAEELTRLLNGAPPAAARQAAPAPAPARTTPAPQSSSASTAPTTAAPARATSTPTPRAAPAPTTAAPARAPVATTPQVPARTPAAAPSAAPAPVQAPAPTPAPAAPPAPVALSSAAVAALPFRIDLPTGFQLFEGRSGPDAHVYLVRKAGKTFAMIYAGPSSQFPIYDGEQVTAAGRVTVVVPEGARRIAMEHLFQRQTVPAEIHVWLMTLEGAERDAAERIAQSVDPK